MTVTEMEEVLKNLDRRLSNVEQILPTLATKEGLNVFATKEDLKAFATKEDLKAFATKEDLKAFATKEDLKAFATKEDLKAFATREDLKAFATKVDLTFATKAEMRELFSEAKRHASMLFEQTQEKLEIIAAHLADLSRRLPPRP